MEFVLAMIVGLVGLSSALELARARKLTRRYVVRSLGLVLLVYGLGALAVWAVLRWGS